MSKTKQKKEALLTVEVLAGPTAIAFEQIRKANVDVTFK